MMLGAVYLLCQLLHGKSRFVATGVVGGESCKACSCTTTGSRRTSRVFPARDELYQGQSISSTLRAGEHILDAGVVVLGLSKEEALKACAG